MLTIVDNEQQRARRDVLDYCVDEPLPGQRMHVEHGRDRVRDESGVRERGELDQSRTIRVGLLDCAGQIEGQPRLAHTAGPGEAEQARVAKQRLQLGKLAAAPNE